MRDYRRYYLPNSIVFITCVTRLRFPYLKSDMDLRLFWETEAFVNQIHPFNLLAYVILPDHFHFLMGCDEGKANFSIILHSLKRNFTNKYKKLHGIIQPIKLWQSRFWDHIIRDEHDYKIHLDYIHSNLVKHPYVENPEDWRQSSFRKWLNDGLYEGGWGFEKEPDNIQKLSLE